MRKKRGGWGGGKVGNSSQFSRCQERLFTLTSLPMKRNDETNLYAKGTTQSMSL